MFFPVLCVCVFLITAASVVHKDSDYVKSCAVWFVNKSKTHHSDWELQLFTLFFVFFSDVCFSLRRR